MIVLQAVLAVLLGLLLVLVVVPFRLRAFASAHCDSLVAGVLASWGFGFLTLRFATGAGLELHILGVRALRIAAKAHSEPDETTEQKSKSKKPRRIASILDHRRALLRMVTRLVHALRLRFIVRGRVGIGDPADTSYMVGVQRLLERIPGVDLDLEWDWVDEELDLAAELSARIWIAHLLALAAALLMVRENREVLRAIS